jgi:hypothetical protein
MDGYLRLHGPMRRGEVSTDIVDAYHFGALFIAFVGFVLSWVAFGLAPGWWKLFGFVAALLNLAAFLISTACA